MLIPQSPDRADAYARLAGSLCVAITEFLTEIAPVADSKRASVPPVAANDNEAELSSRNRGWPDDPMTLAEVQFELRLKQAQIVKLRRLWGFPVPIHREGKLIFSRREVLRWASLQPNPNNLAAVLRLRRKRL